jgi:RNA polymerase primary sigma factor
VTSLDRTVGEDEDTPLGDLFVSEGAEPDRELESFARGESVRRAVAELPDTEREVVQLRYGLTSDQQPRSVEQVVRTLGLSRVEVREIEDAALQRLAHRRELEALRDVA